MGSAPALHVRRTHLRADDGVSIVEAALITPLLLLLTFAVVEFGSLFYVYLALQNGVGQATRFAVTGSVDAGSSRAESIRAAMRRSTPTLTIPDSAFTFQHMSPGAGSWTAGVGGPGDIEKVSVTYTWNLMTPIVRPFFTGGKIEFRADSAMRNEGAF